MTDQAMTRERLARIEAALDDIRSELMDDRSRLRTVERGMWLLAGGLLGMGVIDPLGQAIAGAL